MLMGVAAGCTGNAKLLWAFCNDGWVYWERVTLMVYWKHVYGCFGEKIVMGILQ